MSSKILKCESANDFYNLIPKELNENLRFREDFAFNILSKDKSLQKVIFQWIYEKPHIFYNAFAWTLNPRLKPGYRNRPFILRPQQEKVVDILKDGIDNGFDIGINKSRDEGATELMMKFFTLYCLIVEDFNSLVGSEKEDKVDKTGNQYTLFAKIDQVIKCLPPWWKPRIERTHLHFRCYDTNSAIEGEATNPDFGASTRATVIGLDEYGRVDRAIAESIEGTIHDVADCVIYNSTHWLGQNHPFNKVLNKKTTTVVVLPWYKNPEKNYGLYKSPEINEIEIVDINYYRDICPEVFNDIEPNKPFKYSEFEESLITYPEKVQEKLKNIKFIADGCETIPGDLRSPWHDEVEEERKGNKRDFVSNVWMSAIGASDAVFDDIILNRIKSSHIRPPDYSGDVLLTYNEYGRVNKAKFRKSKHGKLKWWGKLKSNKPDFSHSYIIGADVSLGTGSSNSTAIILDRNTNEQVGEYVTSTLPPQEFADLCVALGKWCNDAYLIWDSTGGHGVNFGRRVRWNGYSSVYIQRTEANKVVKVQNKYGYNITSKSKPDLLGELGIALSEGLKTKPHYKSIRIHSDELLDELFDYIYLEGGEIEASERADLKSGARKRHGDRVIATALCVLGLKYRSPAKLDKRKKISKNSTAYRMQEYDREQEKIRKKYRRFRY